ncbi:MAG: TolC family protein [Thermodesulfobacteriota bacterium]
MRELNPVRMEVILAIVFWMILPFSTRAEEVITLEKALETALARNPVLKAAESDVAASRARVTQATSAYYPQVNATGGYSYRHNETESALPNGSGRKEEYSGGLLVSQLLYDFSRTSGLLKSSRQSLIADRYDLDAVRNTLIRDVKIRYVEALKRQQLEDVSRKALNVRIEHLELARALYRQGMRPKIDVIRSEAEVSQAELSLVQARYALQQARVGLETVLGGSPAQGKYLLAETGPILQTPAGLDSLLSLAYRRRPELFNYEARIRAAEETRNSIGRSSWPNLNADGAYLYSGTEFPLDDRWEAGVSLKWELFTGFRRTGRIHEAEAEIRGLQALMENRKLQVAEEVTQAYLQVYEAREALKTAQTGLKQAKETLDLSEGRYRAGVGNAIEISDAQILHTQAQNSLVQAVYDHLKAWAELEYAIGEDLSKL